MNRPRLHHIDAVAPCVRRGHLFVRKDLEDQIQAAAAGQRSGDGGTESRPDRRPFRRGTVAVRRPSHGRILVGHALPRRLSVITLRGSIVRLLRLGIVGRRRTGLLTIVVCAGRLLLLLLLLRRVLVRIGIALRLTGEGTCVLVLLRIGILGVGRRGVLWRVSDGHNDGGWSR